MNFEKTNTAITEVKGKEITGNSMEGVSSKLSPENSEKLEGIQNKIDKLQDKIEQNPNEVVAEKDNFISELKEVENSYNSIKEKLSQGENPLSIESIPQLKEISTQLKEINASLQNLRIDKNTNYHSDIQFTEVNRRMPTSNGVWEGERGNSKWIPEGNFTPINKDGSNPENLSMEKILSKYNTDGIHFNNGEPDFSSFSHSTIEIPNFSDKRYGIGGNFDQADKIFADHKGISLKEVYEYKGKYNVTWHERGDCKTMDLVPREIHNNVRHDGGISAYKKINNY